MMEGGAVIWPGQNGPLPRAADEVEKNAYHQATPPVTKLRL